MLRLAFSVVSSRAWFTALLLILSGPLLLARDAGETAPEFTLPVLEGSGSQSLSDHRGHWVYVDFWASWCGPCRKSLPVYEGLYRELAASNFRILAINLDEFKPDATRFLTDHPVTYTVLWDPAGVTPAAWQVQAMPSSFLLNTEGQIVQKWAGFELSHIEEIRNAVLQHQQP